MIGVQFWLWVMGAVPQGQLLLGGDLIIVATLFITWRENVRSDDRSLAVA